jgi:3-oxoacyl-[acyl-carrier-protein] synthase III
VAPAPAGEPGDLDVLQTYAGGPVSQVDSIIWPNPEFDNDITVYGPEVKALAGRYLEQMMGELRELGIVDDVDLVVPHQANRTMVTELAARAGLEAEQLYFDIDEVGNVSAASIPIALHDAVRDGVIDRPLRIFAPGFGAGAVGGYAVLRVDPAVVALDDGGAHEDVGEPRRAATAGASAQDVVTAFG